jgi:hypothetical protein
VSKERPSMCRYSEEEKTAAEQTVQGLRAEGARFCALQPSRSAVLHPVADYAIVQDPLQQPAAGLQLRNQYLF